MARAAAPRARARAPADACGPGRETRAAGAARRPETATADGPPLGDPRRRAGAEIPHVAWSRRRALEAGRGADGGRPTRSSTAAAAAAGGGRARQRFRGAGRRRRRCRPATPGRRRRPPGAGVAAVFAAAGRRSRVDRTSSRACEAARASGPPPLTAAPAAGPAAPWRTRTARPHRPVAARLGDGAPQQVLVPACCCSTCPAPGAAARPSRWPPAARAPPRPPSPTPWTSGRRHAGCSATAALAPLVDAVGGVR